MKKRTAVISCLVTFCFAAWIAWGRGDPWKNKPFQQWTDQDIHKVLVESPWGKVVANVGGPWVPMGNVNLSGNTPGQIAGTAGSASNNTTGVLPAEHSPDSGVASQGRAYEVLWWSSRTIRAAAAQRAVLHEGKSEKDAESFVDAPVADYEILVRGPDMTAFTRGTEEEFMKKAFLQLKKPKVRIAPSKVEFQRGPDGHTVMEAVFYFSRKDANGAATIPPDEKEVDFYCTIGDGTLRTYFNPPKMVDSKGQDM